ncbi:RNA-guided endonuclease InsQ/TnpB family protein [Ectothiorhodospira shaposhnikovii]|uniref:RNA-guided endonuclease InsQ/TnpB family protein n=1 Tax=Ectothiorhodospira shaposhnikovii TaxID=1054 RepID=UPI001EE8EB2D|nr:transposase [Ectothiorhodospira shaposhnikovii]MCG5513279.1 transposase [Ectothiorhodospira shaposhnikovii]
MTDAAKTIIKTLSVRVKDRHAKVLDRMGFEVNQVWNLANEMAYEAWHVPVPEVGWIQGVWLHPFDIQKALAGINKARGWLIGSATIQEVIAVHGKSRKQFNKSKLRWRVSGGPRRSLGWIPFKSRAARFEGGKVRFAGESFGVWDSYGLENFKFRAGSFSQDARGRWYFHVQVEVAAQEKSEGSSAVGIDLGLKDVATCSDGERLSASQPYRTLEEKLGIAQRAGKKKRIKAIHAKIKHRRKDAIHKFSTMLVERHGAIFVGDVSSVSLAKTRMAKSVLDAGWGMLKTQLQYKAIARGVWFEEIDEAYTTQACSCCGHIGDSSPKGRTGLGIREWTCQACGTRHDRDINAARNILALGHKRLAGGITRL